MSPYDVFSMSRERHDPVSEKWGKHGPINSLLGRLEVMLHKEKARALPNTAIDDLFTHPHR